MSVDFDSVLLTGQWIYSRQLSCAVAVSGLEDQNRADSGILP